jgi:hypothetical protein
VLDIDEAGLLAAQIFVHVGGAHIITDGVGDLPMRPGRSAIATVAGFIGGGVPRSRPTIRATWPLAAKGLLGLSVPFEAPQPATVGTPLTMVAEAPLRAQT